jgi:hypothetical protein
MNPTQIDRSVLVARLATLKSEYTSGQRLLADIEARRASLSEQLLRIGGAAQVLEELLNGADEPSAASTTAVATE